ncbi:unnamed protein product [Phytomonas sp. EM1]|nr:unnamed protein product [Phytomonas sp. EM1]|eukprot:CCW63216.1 unnamed protein product [Phytomonas sp. isolate EM1]
MADRPGWMAYFDDVLERGFADNDYIPELIPEAWMTSDQTFMQSLNDMVHVIANNQRIGLQMILDEANKEKARVDEDKSTSNDETVKND